MDRETLLLTLLPLLRSALLGTPLEEEALESIRALEEKDWVALLETAEQQTVSGLLYLAAEHFPEGISLPESIYWELMKRVNLLANRSRRMAALESEILSMLSSAGLHPLVMKGSTCAARYPAPELRLAGDIDLYLSAISQQRADRIVVQFLHRIQPQESSIIQENLDRILHDARKRALADPV